MISPLFRNKTLHDKCNIDEESWFIKPPEGFVNAWRTGNDLELDSLFDSDGTLYLLHQLVSDEGKDVVVGVPTNGKMRIWQNGQFLHETKTLKALRPNLGNGNALGDMSNYKTTRLSEGWNQFLIKIERFVKPMEAHFVIGGIHPSCVKNHGVTVFGIDQSRFIWEI